MNKNYRVITINGVRGIITIIFVVLGLIAGFIISPGWVCMKLWNVFFEHSFVMMNLIQGIMLWAILALSLYALNNNRPLIGFGNYSGLTQEQIKDIMTRARKSENRIIKELEEMHRKEEKNKETTNVNVDVQKNVTVEEVEEVRK